MNEEYYAGITRDKLKSLILSYRVVQHPESVFGEDAEELIKMGEYIASDELAEAILELPETKSYIDRLFRNVFVGPYDAGFDDEMLYKYARIAIKNIKDYTTRKALIMAEVKRRKRENKKTFFLEQVREAKKTLRAAGIKKL